MPLTFQPFQIEVVPGAPAFPVPNEAGAGLAVLLRRLCEQCSPAAGGGTAEDAVVTGHLWAGDRWQAELQIGGERHADEAGFAQAHHLLFRMLERVARAAGRELTAPVSAGFDDLATVSPAALLSYLEGLAGDTRRGFTRAFELDPGFAAPRIALARLVLATGDAPAAAGLLQGITVASPYAASELGIALWATGDAETAMALLPGAVLGNPKDAVAAAALAALLARRGGENAALDEAQLLATQSTQLAPDDYRTWSALADVHRARADFDQAAFYYGSALRLQPDSATVLKDAGACWLMAGQPGRALPLIERALAIAPGDAENLGNLAFARDATGDARAALQAARQAVAKSPEDARFWILQGDLAHKVGRREEALESWARATELDPGFTLNPEGGNIGQPGH